MPCPQQGPSRRRCQRFDTASSRLYDPRAMDKLGALPLRISSRTRLAAIVFLLALTAIVTLLFHRGPRRAPAATEPRIVSLVPQATETLVAIGCGDHLAGVSNYDVDPAVAGLPRVGDYETCDWESISSLKPQWIVTHYAKDRPRPGFDEHLSSIGARHLNLQTETLNGSDATQTIYYAIGRLGRICNEPAKAAAAEARLRARLAAVGQRVKNQRPARTLIVIGAEGTMVAGRETFLSELAILAGGENVASSLAERYPNIDAEQLLTFAPEAILQLLPGAAPQVREQAKKHWSGLPNVPAVKNGRVVQLTQWYLMLPGYHVGDIAELFADALHPSGAH